MGSMPTNPYEMPGMKSGNNGNGKPFGTPDNPSRSRGRPPGSPNKMGHDLMTMVMETATELGFLKEDPETKKLVATGEGGAKGYLKWIGLNKPERFVALMARVAPRHVFADVTHHDDDSMTAAELEAELIDRGLPLDLLPMLLKYPEDDRLDPGEDPDPYHMMKDVTPASTNGGATNGNENDTAK
jgi:hypothetical protein